MKSCTNCRHCKCYKGDYWTPDDYECTKVEEIEEEVFDKVWEDDRADLCPCYEDAPTEEDIYWEKYAWEENHYDKDRID